MKTMISIPVLAIAFTALAIPASADPSGGPGHKHGYFSAGAPGNPKQPARTVTITMSEADGKMLFQPDRIEVRRGEQVRFVLQNHGELEHEFVLGTEQENAKHADLMLKYPEMEHDDPNARRLKAKLKDALIWRFTKRGEFEFACLIPGHRDAGMHGKIVVK
jgi:uncharacterized cupredoxin-like copper-binding protein